MDTGVAAKWESMLSNQDEPKYLRNVVRYGYSQFLESLQSPTPQLIKELAESIYSGDILVLEGALSEGDIQHIRNKVVEFGNSVPAERHPILDGCPNYHAINDPSQAPPGGYVELDHSYYFFRWNGDDFGLFDLLDNCWSASKVLGGLEPDQYVRNLPRDNFVDRMQVIRYPPGGGRLSTHKDPTASIKVNIGVYLTSFGEQYKQGGFYVLDSDGKRRILDPEIKAGDILLWYPTVAHGVEPVDPDLPLDWAANDGRWFISLVSVESNHVKDRHPAVPVDG